jgi:hypothetical protein
MLRPEDILPTPKAEIERLRLRKRFRKYKDRQPRMKLSREELLKYVRDRGIRSVGELVKKRKEDEPNLHDFRKVFGKWSTVELMAFGPPIASEMTPQYIVNCVRHLNMRSVKRFREMRREMPDVVPSWSVVIRHFRSYRNLFEIARRSNLYEMLFEYQKLIRRLGKIPTTEEIRAANLHLDDLIGFYGSKKELDSFVAGLKGTPL